MNWTLGLGMLAAVVVAALATVGIFGGGAYAALVIGLAAILLVCALAHRRLPHWDRPVAVLALAFVLLCWASALWSIAPDRTLRGAAQMTGVLLAATVLVGEGPVLAPSATWILRAGLIASVLGPALAFLDFAAGHPVMLHVVAHPELTGSLDTKLDRGLTYQTILVWPLLAYGWSNGRRSWAAVAALALVAALIVSRSDSGRLAFVVAAVVLAVGAIRPRVATIGVAAIIAAAVATPILAAALAGISLPLADAFKHSFANRLEIWDYMSARTWQRPFGGWGWWSANTLPITPDELARYKYVSAAGSPHPHNHWLQLWVETGVLGAALGASFAVLLLRRAWVGAANVRPFALAAIAAALTISLTSYDLATDSWWCALAATGLLFRLQPKTD